MSSNTPRLPPSKPTIAPRRDRPLRRRGPLFHCRMIMALISGILLSSSLSSWTAAFVPIVTKTATAKATLLRSYKSRNDCTIRILSPCNNFGSPQQHQPPQHRQYTSITSKTTTTTAATTRLFGTNSDGDPPPMDVDGLKTAPYLFGIVLVLCVWNFTIPTEFRRARLCSAQQVRDYPESNCKTWSQYTSGIQDYYRHGGTLFRFDFSVDRENNIWITGPQEILE